ncbi:MAG TPA: hypothetical protein VJJ23_05650 [Candidatus Nanoarchaeia archaeon]|nr:hypothetical protein [Candidatus Pacearchaeota archaeon]HLC56693.1 hypothetical protein [Candidatus Nanoarchaeia archaeon]
MKKNIAFIGVLILIILSSSFLVSAVTGKIGNGRMVLSMEVGDTIGRYVTIINDNDEPLNITLFVSGDLKDELKLEETNFILEPNTEKKANFIYKAKKAGTYDTKINVQFAPLNAKNGVGLSSTVIIKVYGRGDLPDNTNTNTDENSTGSVSVKPNSNNAIINNNRTKFNPIYLFGISTIILLVVFLGLLYFIYSKKTRGVKGGVANGNKVKREIKK